MDSHHRITLILGPCPLSCPRWVYLPNLILLHPRPPHTLNNLSLHLITPEPILPILLPLPRPLPSIVERVRPLALPQSLRKRSKVLLPRRPFHLPLPLKHPSTPHPTNRPPVVHHQDPLSVKLVLLEGTFIHALLEVELSLASPHSLVEIPLVNTPICHPLPTETMRQVVPPISLNKPSIRGGQFPLSGSHPICHLTLIHAPIGECHLYPLTLGQVAQEELASEGGTVLPNDLPPLMGLSLHRPTRVSHSSFQLDHLDAALHAQRPPHLSPCTYIQVFHFSRRRGGRGRGTLTGYFLRSVDDN